MQKPQIISITSFNQTITQVTTTHKCSHSQHLKANINKAAFSMGDNMLKLRQKLPSDTKRTEGVTARKSIFSTDSDNER